MVKGIGFTTFMALLGLMGPLQSNETRLPNVPSLWTSGYEKGSPMKYYITFQNSLGLIPVRIHEVHEGLKYPDVTCRGQLLTSAVLALHPSTGSLTE